MAEDPEGLERVTTIQALAERVSHGGTLQDDEAAFVSGSQDLIAIGMMADDVRHQLHGDRTTFLRVFEMHVDAVPAALPAALSAGEFRIVGRPASVDAAVAAVAQARHLAGSGVLNAFSLADLAEMGAAEPRLFTQLKSAGLDEIAEVPVDLVEPGVVALARAAGLPVRRLTVHAVPSDPVGLVARARQMQRIAGGFRAFAPLPRTISIASPTTGYEDVKLVAISRLLIREISSIQVDWPLYGPKLAQVALTFGADDVDGVAAVETGLLGTRRSAIEEIRLNIRAAGLQPVERDARFEVLAAS
jgi:aminodeoxyfutalosine synthase